MHVGSGGANVYTAVRGRDVEGYKLTRDEFTDVNGEGGKQVKDSSIHSTDVPTAYYVLDAGGTL